MTGHKFYYIGCHGCQASGQVDGHPCPACKGRGDAFSVRDAYAQEVEVVHGVTMRWEYRARYDYLAGEAERWGHQRPRPKGELLAEGTVFVPLELIERLNEQGHWDSQFGSPFIDLSPRQGWALEQAGFAVQETRGGYHRTDYTQGLLDALSTTIEGRKKT